MNNQLQLVVFRLDKRRYALPLAAVERIVRAVEITPLPNAPAIVLGVMNMAGDVIPVIDLRRSCGMPEREITAADQLLVATTGGRTVALLVDETEGLIEPPASAVISVADIVPGVGQLRGVVKRDDGLVLIHDLEKFLSLDEVQALDAAMAGAE
jgi:purine-binding chemotaxis protein CheW